MKKGIILAVLALVAMTVQAKVDVESSETVELMSILSRTAGWPQYHMDQGGQYIEDVEAWFAPFENHSFIGFYNDFMEKNTNNFAAPMDLAIALTIEGGQIKMLYPKQSISDDFKNADLDGFIRQLNQFYTDTRFHEFYQQHQDFYNKVLQDYRTNVMQYFNQDWYAPFYGTNPEEVFRVIIGFTNGGHNYGPSIQYPGKPKENFSICGYWLYPDGGYVYDSEHGRQAAPTLVHEFNHSFVNYLQDIEKNAALLGNIPQRLLEKEMFRMTQFQSYSRGSIVLNESVVRAAVIIYMMENGFTPKEVKAEMESDILNGFTWLPELVTAMRYYNTHQNKYPTLNDFYPEIIKTLSNYLDSEQKRIDVLPKNLKATNDVPSSCKFEVLETSELMAILARTAQFDEYCQRKYAGSYDEDIDKWFASYSDHPAVSLMQEMRQNAYIMYDAVASMGVHLAIENGKIVMLDEELAADEEGLDRRWKNVDMDAFLAKLNQFYTDTRFHEFYQQHQDFYNKALDIYNQNMMKQVHPEWFSRFYGVEDKNQYRNVMCFANGGGWYGAYSHPKSQAKNVFNVMGYYDMDPTDAIQFAPQFAAGIIKTVSRDCSIQSLAGIENVPSLKDTGERLLEANRQLFRNLRVSKGSDVLGQSIEGAAYVIYMMENGASPEEVRMALQERMYYGYTWMPELVNALLDYTAHRNKYPTINDFYPQLAKVLNKYIDNEQKRRDKALK